MYNLSKKQFDELVDELEVEQIASIINHQKAVCDIFGLKFDISPKDDYQIAVNHFDIVKDVLVDKLQITNLDLKVLQDCTTILENIIDTRHRLLDFVKKTEQTNSRNWLRKIQAVYDSSYLLTCFMVMNTKDSLNVLRGYLMVKIQQIEIVCQHSLDIIDEAKGDRDYPTLFSNGDRLVTILDEVIAQFDERPFDKKLVSLYKYQNND